MRVCEKYFQNIARTLHTKFHQDIFKIDEVIKLFPTLEEKEEKKKEKEKEEKKKRVSDEASPRKNDKDQYTPFTRGWT